MSLIYYNINVYKTPKGTRSVYKLIYFTNLLILLSYLWHILWMRCFCSVCVNVGINIFIIFHVHYVSFGSDISLKVEPSIYLFKNIKGIFTTRGLFIKISTKTNKKKQQRFKKSISGLFKMTQREKIIINLLYPRSHTSRIHVGLHFAGAQYWSNTSCLWSSITNTLIRYCLFKTGTNNLCRFPLSPSSGT